MLAAARELDVQYEWTQWEYFGRNPADPRHIEQSTIDLIKYEKPVVGLGEQETAIINFAPRDLWPERRLSSETFAQVQAFIRPQRHRAAAVGNGQLFGSRGGD